MNLPAELAAIRALDAARTPGEWYGDANFVAELLPEGYGTMICSVLQDAATRDFIAAAPRMVALIEELAAENERLRKDAERYRWLRRHQHCYPFQVEIETPYFGTSPGVRLDDAIDAAAAGRWQNP